MTSDPNADISKTEVDARQGTTRPKVIYVLIGGVALVLIAFAIAYLVGVK